MGAAFVLAAFGWGIGFMDLRCSCAPCMTSTSTEAADTKLSSAFCFAPRSLASARDRTSTAVSSSVVTMASENGETFAG